LIYLYVIALRDAFIQKNHNNLLQGNWYHKQDSNHLPAERKS